VKPQETPQPVHEFRIGGTITASVWRNEAQQGDRTVATHSVQLQKRYFHKGDQEWKTSGSLFANEIPRAILALQRAYEWILTQPRSEAAEDDDTGRV
jgi:hypothetical protein